MEQIAHVSELLLVNLYLTRDSTHPSHAVTFQVLAQHVMVSREAMPSTGVVEH
jgi:hypothetical protein